ncbi:protein GL2-INTERACTING REPRESSOR 1-like [Wolffia australiana]
MSRSGKGPRLDLRLNLTIPPARLTAAQVAAVRGGGSPEGSPASSSSSPSSCLSSDSEQGRYASSPEATSMVLLGCPRCLMYVMLSEDDPKCPKCKSTVLLDFLNDHKNTAAAKKN